ncbi:unnamed protein product, partial [Brassica oleracea]
DSYTKRHIVCLFLGGRHNVSLAHIPLLYPASCLLLPRTTLGCCKESVSFLEVLFLSL